MDVCALHRFRRRPIRCAEPLFCIYIFLPPSRLAVSAFIGICLHLYFIYIYEMQNIGWYSAEARARELRAGWLGRQVSHGDSRQSILNRLSMHTRKRTSVARLSMPVGLFVCLVRTHTRQTNRWWNSEETRKKKNGCDITHALVIIASILHTRIL